MANGPRQSLDASTPALIFKTGQFPLHHGILGAIRSLGRLGVPVYSALEDRFVPAGFSRYLAGKFIWNPDENASEALVDGLRLIGERIGRPAVLISANDHDAIFIEEHADQLAEWYRFPRPAAGLTRSLANKQRLHDIAAKAGLPYPRSATPSSFAEIEDLAAAWGFPLLVKIVEPWRRPRLAGLSSTSFVEYRAQLLNLFRIAQGPPACPLLVQEHVPSAGDTDAMYAAYCDGSSRCLVSMTGEKLRSYPAHAGMTASGRSWDNPELRTIAENFLGRIDYRGIVDLEFRRDVRDGTYKLLDFNPRLGAQFRLYESEAGIDVVRAMYLDLTGQPIPSTPRAKARSLIVENYELRVMWAFCRLPGSGIRTWLRSLPGQWEFAWFAQDDLNPCIAMWLRLLLNYLWQRIVPRRSPLRKAAIPIYVASRWRMRFRARPS